MTDNNLEGPYWQYTDTLKKLIVSGTQMLSEYQIAYTLSFSGMLLLLSNGDRYYLTSKNMEKDAYNDWLKYTDAQFSEHLQSSKFLDSLQKYQEAIIDANTYAKKMGYFPALSLLDDYIDNSLKTLSSESESSIFLSTPYEVMQKNDDTRLLRYQEEYKRQTFTSKRKFKYKTPLLMVYAPINRYHILDLTPDRSIVNQFVSKGFDVFLLDWGEQKNNRSTISDYVNYIDEYVQEIKKITNSDKINLFGYSWGGVLSMIYASLDNNKTVNSLMVQSSQVDFDKDKSTIAEWMRSFPADRFIEEFGEMHGHIIDLAFLMRNPLIRSFDNVRFALGMQKNKNKDGQNNNDRNATFLKFVQDLFRISVWLNNTPDIQGEFFREFAKKMYQKNLLIKGQVTLDERASSRNENESTRKSSKTIDLKDITIPVLNIVATEDDLVQAESCVPLNDIISSTDKKLILFPSGHVELCISSDSHENLWPQVVSWLQSRSS
jgi:polyhydroxyalkanoate synthase